MTARWPWKYSFLPKDIVKADRSSVVKTIRAGIALAEQQSARSKTIAPLSTMGRGVVKILRARETCPHFGQFD